jgi:pimeloyl-ACP methyl ester carboxylesterase
MINLAKTNLYRVYALDFWGFGDSAKGVRASSDSFQIVSYVDMVGQFMDKLGIQEAPVFGHSMGGTVALEIALSNPERVNKVAVVGSPVIGNSLNPFLQLAGYGVIAKLMWRYPFLLHSIMRILLAKDSKKVRSMISRDVQRTTIESFFRSIGDLRNTDLRADIPRLAMPALGIYGANDNIVSPSNAKLLSQGKPDTQIALMAHSRHFPMIDEPDIFMETLLAFLNDGREPQNNVHKKSAS